MIHRYTFRADGQYDDEQRINSGQTKNATVATDTFIWGAGSVCVCGGGGGGGSCYVNWNYS